MSELRSSREKKMHTIVGWIACALAIAALTISFLKAPLKERIDSRTVFLRDFLKNHRDDPDMKSLTAEEVEQRRREYTRMEEELNAFETEKQQHSVYENLQLAIMIGLFLLMWYGAVLGRRMNDTSHNSSSEAFEESMTHHSTDA
jgi:Na+/melibiose symporter-like transporter